MVSAGPFALANASQLIWLYRATISKVFVSKTIVLCGSIYMSYRYIYIYIYIGYNDRKQQDCQNAGIQTL